MGFWDSSGIGQSIIMQTTYTSLQTDNSAKTS